MFSTFTWNGPNGSTSHGTTSPEDCFDRADPSVCQELPRTSAQCGAARQSQCPLSAQQRKSRSKAKNGLKWASCLCGRKRTFQTRWEVPGHGVHVALLHFPNDFSLFYGHNLWGDCGGRCTWVTAENIALASISRHFPQSQNHHS